MQNQTLPLIPGTPPMMSGVQYNGMTVCYCGPDPDETGLALVFVLGRTKPVTYREIGYTGDECKGRVA